MKEFKYEMSTDIHFGKDVIINKSKLFSGYGSSALIVTGKSSSKKNGSLNDVKTALDMNQISYTIYDDIEENPSTETVDKAAKIARDVKADFIVGVGGGSPIDAAKAIGILVKNKKLCAYDIFDGENLKSVPIIAVATTAGTGTEVTPFAVLTDHKNKTKRNFGQRVFPAVAFLDGKYLENTPNHVTVNTAIDALSHLIESYMSTDSNFMSEIFVEKGLAVFSECLSALKSENYSLEIRGKLLLSSTLAGVSIAQSGTSIPHGMGYALTYHKKVAHGIANGVLLKNYLKICKDKDKVDNILRLLKFHSLDEFGEYIAEVLKFNFTITEEEMKDYANVMASNEGKLKNHPIKISEKQLYEIYRDSF
jgi:alcohol dehydrogenase